MAKYASQEVPGSYNISDLIDLLNSASERTEQSYMSSLDNILKAGQSSLTQEQISNAQQALNNISSGASYSDSTNLAFDVVKSNLDNQQFEIDKYTSSIQQGADIINSPNFLDEAEDWRNLEDLRKSKTNKDGTYTYESVGSMLADEYIAIESLYNNINNKNFRYNKDATFDDQEVINKINQYKNRLDKAVQANLGDGIITIDEAQLIISGVTKPEFDKVITSKKTELKDLINEQQSLVRTINGKLAGKAGDEQYTELMKKFLPNMTNEEQIIMAGNDPVAIGKMLKKEQEKLDTLYTQWQYWSGSGYGEKAPQQDSNELGGAADEVLEGLEVSVPSDVGDWSDTAYTKEEIEEPDKPRVPVEGEDELFDEEITLKGDEPLEDYKFNIEKPETPTVPIEGEDVLEVGDEVTLKGDQPLKDYKIPTPKEVIESATEKAKKEAKTKKEIREAEYYTLLPETDFDIKIGFTGNIKGDEKNKAKVNNIYQNIKQMGIEDIEKNIEQLYENFSFRGKLYSDRELEKNRIILSQMQQILNRIEKGGSTFSNVDSLKGKLIKKYNQLMKAVERNTKSRFMESEKTIKPSKIGYKKWLEKNPDAEIFERE